MLLHVEVTSEDAKNGRVNSCTLCPVALAVNRALEKAGFTYKASVFTTEVCFFESWKFTMHPNSRLPVAARDFIFRFDGGQDVEPISFDLELPEQPASS